MFFSAPISSWEEIKEDYEGFGFYGCDFRAPSGWKDKDLRLRFGVVNYHAEVWLNGQVVGYHEGGYKKKKMKGIKDISF